MSREFPKIENYVVASDVEQRDGVGVEIYSGGKMIMEVFRDDTKMKREVTLYQKELELDVVEQAIAIFKKEIPHDYQD